MKQKIMLNTILIVICFLLETRDSCNINIMNK